MLRLLDPASGAEVPLRPARAGLLRICVHDPGRAARDATVLRILLVADLLARIAETRGLQALIALTCAAPPHPSEPILRPEADALGIHRPTAHTVCHDAQHRLGGPIDVHLIRQGAPVPALPGGRAVIIGQARGAALQDYVASDPLAFRLTLMSVPYDQPTDLSADSLATARRSLGSWRHSVAAWAESPSAPVPSRIAETVEAALDRLDTVSVIQILRDLVDRPDVAADAKFETFALADRTLGLEVVRDVGRPLE